jgi:DNA polymerase-3 subunit epsilon
MKNILLADFETSGLDATKDQIVEVGAILWSVEHRCAIECFSTLIPAATNPEEVNGIPTGLLCNPDLPGRIKSAIARFDDLAEYADCIVAHHAEFDRGFYATAPKHAEDRTQLSWVCTIEDFVWPKATPSKGLVAVALAHGIGVLDAHRALTDCQTLARVFGVIPDIAERLEAALAHAQLPKAEMISLAPFELKDVVKENGFHWDPARRVWHRTMAIEDAKKLPFATRVAK